MKDDDTFEVGDEVLLVGMPNELNGSAGKLTRMAGKDRWAVSIIADGKEKKTVVSIKNLQRLGDTAVAPETKADTAAAKPKRYDIIGTWDDWEPHPMDWIERLHCYEYVAELRGDENMESFKFLAEGDWELCVYPNKSCATLHDNHIVCGPDDGGMDTEWTIGHHEADSAAPGARYQVRLFFSGAQPQRVAWELLGIEVKSANTPRHQKDTFPDEVNKLDRPTSNVPAPGSTRGLDVQVPQKTPEEQEVDVEAVERAARDRLVRRLEMAAEAERLAIMDMKDGDLQPVEAASLELSEKLALNKKRYVAHNGPRKERAQMMAHSAFTNLSADVDADKENKRRASSGAVGTAPHLHVEHLREKGNCMECNVVTENVLDVGGWICAGCWRVYNELQKEGWNGSIFIKGKMAAQLAQQILNERASQNMTIGMARREVLRRYPDAFKREAEVIARPQ